MRSLFIAALSFVAAGCVGGGGLLVEPELGPEVPPWSVPVEWEACTLFTGGGGGPAECANVRMPLDWAEPTEAQISVFVKRVTGSGVDPDDAEFAVWPLSGGPGGAGNMQESLAELFLSNDDSLVFYLLDHRGTGRSMRLGCAAEGSDTPGGRTITVDELAQCGEEVRERWDDDLSGFTTTQAAIDLAWLIDTTRPEGQSVHIHGGSYGTRWMQRTLQVAPNIADGASGLGVVPPGFSFADYDASYEAVGAAYMDLCIDDIDCVARLGGDPLATMREALGNLQTGACPVGDDSLTRERLRSFFGALLLAGGDARVAIPAVAHRLDRCNGDDREALRWFAENVADPLEGLRNDPMYSQVLGNLVILSELWDDGPSVDDALDLHRQGLFSLGSTLRVAQLEEADWPRAARDPRADEALVETTPLLWINGSLDPATPLEPVIDMLDDMPDRAEEHLLVIPGGGHGWDSPTIEGYDCARTAWWNFVREPGSTLFACDAQILPPDLSGDTTTAQWLFGRDDLWGSYQGD
ncbi:MAG: alpha/beta hydrolase [Deltaproteobacteria bacterium]|nr:alpha/beta hydrolase [Deltaproteobacteria bacterium]